MNYYERHIGDYLKDTAHLSLLEHGIYTRLMDVYYTRETPIPMTDAARLIGARSKDEREALQSVLSEFFEIEADAYVQHRCDNEILKFADKSGKAKRSALARWDAKRLQSDGNADAMRTHSEGNALAMLPIPKPNHQSPVTKEKKSASAPSIPELSESLMADFLKVRKAKSAPLTETAIAGIRREADKAGLTMVEAITECVECNWQGFRADWHTERKSKTKTNGNTPASQHKFSAAAKTIYGYENNERTIDV